MTDKSTTLIPEHGWHCVHLFYQIEHGQWNLFGRDEQNAAKTNLAKLVQERGAFGLKELMEMQDYPQPARIQAFYAQSVSVVQFLTKQKDPQVFTQFMRDGLRYGYESALQKHYGYQGFADLEQRWLQATFGDDPNSLAQANR